MIKNPVIPVVVAYHPKAGELEANIKSLLQNFKEAVVVWNGPHPFQTPAFLKDPKIHFLDMKMNVGLALALNKGIQKACDLGAAWVYLSDQDSILPKDFKRLMVEYSGFIPKNIKVAAIGPRYYNEVIDEKNRLIRFNFIWIKRHRPNLDEIYAKAEYLITSGLFISKEVFLDVGLMREELFIDFIDIEWGLRAKSKGYEFVALPSITLHHRLGDVGVRIFGMAFPIHSPLRIYYYFRNAIYLYKQNYIAFNWKLIDGTRNIFRFLFYIVLIKPRLQYLKMALLGIYHGFFKRMGKLKDS